MGLLIKHVLCRFMRKGQIDSYKDEMSEDWITRFDERIADWECKEILNKP